jgi:Fur family transcriptional regulator, zinc uptake regulator
MPGDAWIAQVEAVCQGRGLQITALRRNVLGIFAKADQPLGAYAIIQKLSEAQKRIVAPPTVYRTLDFLVENGFVFKIESRQTYVACDHVDHHDHHGVVFSCARCGRTVEVDSTAIDGELASIADRLGFRSERQVIEIEGQCAVCSSS